METTTPAVQVSQVAGQTDEPTRSRRETLVPLVRYFLKLGTIGFGGPVALVGFMHRDLVERRRWVAEDTYRLALAFAQIMPGPLAAQCAIALGYFEHGFLGATFVGLAFVLPSFIMVVLLSMAYVAFGGLWWMQALFYGIGAAVIPNDVLCPVVTYVCLSVLAGFRSNIQGS